MMAIPTDASASGRKPWYQLRRPLELNSPSLLFYWNRIERNVASAISMAGSADRLRPHVKTHKNVEISQLQIEKGIRKFKCATVAEAEMLGEAQAQDVLLAYPAVGPTVDRMMRLCEMFPRTSYAFTVESVSAARSVADRWSAAKPCRVYLDLDPGMHRTGISIDENALRVALEVSSIPHVSLEGIHVYDGHNGQSDYTERTAAVDAIRERIEWFTQRFAAEVGRGLKPVCGGTPSFPCYARFPDVDLSPGTFVLHDRGYATRFPDLPFEPAALLLSRVISRPTADRFTIDLGYKAISADPTGLRGEVLGFPEAEPVVHSEEHWTWRTPRAGELAAGDIVYVMPTHICPTVALHREAFRVDDRGEIVGALTIRARDRVLSV